MPRKLDENIGGILRQYGFGPEACWDCHGTWVVYHKVLEAIAAKAGINFDPPMVLEANGEKKCVALCVTGRLGERAIWSTGEASPHNYRTKQKQTAYPYAMAEKRAMDRVILKLIGLHGLAYSEEEADDFTPEFMKDLPKAGSRDITDGVGSQPAEMGQLDVLTPWGEVEKEFTDPEEYLGYLTEKLESVGAYFPPNEDNLIWLGKNITDKKIQARARSVYKLGRDAWANSPDHPDNRINDPAQQQPLEGPEKPTGAPF